MTSKHTPGPWRHEPTNSAKLTYVAVSTILGSNGSTVVIGQCAGPDKEANARLIAAAPELLAFVQECAERNPIYAKGYEKERIAKAIALVAKATGDAV